MKIKSIPEDPRITLSTLKDIIKITEKIESDLNDTSIPTSYAYDAGRLNVLKMFLGILGVEFEPGDNA